MPDALASPVAGRPHVHTSLWTVGLFGVALLLVFHQTTWSMVSIWLRSETFAHGFLILPIFLWLIWDQRESLKLIDPKPALWVALLIIPPGFVWLLAWLVDVLVVQQLAMVAMLIVGTWAILGHQLARALVFPLLFLFFAVPMGEALIPPMMEFTATSTVWLIQKTGIPVYREGLYFSLPSGHWSVVEACSGVRYIIASVTLGVLYAYLTYRSAWRRGLFVLVSAIVPVFANTLRAYIIVMLGHVSDMKIAVGVDHLIYGWVFFGIVIFLLFWLGSFFREDHGALSDGATQPAATPGGANASRANFFATALVALLAAGLWPVLAFTTESRNEPEVVLSVTPPTASGAWLGAAEPEWQWQPAGSVAGRAVAYYDLSGQALALYIQYAQGARDGGEIVGSSTRFVTNDDGLRVVDRGKATLQIGGKDVLVDQAQLRSGSGQLLAWSWYRIGDLHTSNDYAAKLREAWASLGFGASGSYRIVVIVPRLAVNESMLQLLQDFLDEHDDQLDEALDDATQDGLG